MFLQYLEKSMSGSALVHEVFGRVALREMVYDYCEAIWRDGWRPGKTKALENPNDPFQGGPKDLMARGFTVLAGVKGPITLTPQTRVRWNDLTDEARAAIGLQHLIGVVTENVDVVHPEYVETYQENIDTNDYAFANNAAGAASALDAIVGFVATPATTMAELVTLLEETLAGSWPEIATFLTAETRAAWLGRVIVDGAWKVSSDFTFYSNLRKNAADLDSYVVVPVLKMFVADLHAGKFSQV